MRSAFAFLCAFIAASCWGQEPISLADHCTDPGAPDHTECIIKWVNAGAGQPGRKLYAPPGVYRYSGAATIYSGMQLECAGPSLTLFRNIDPTRSAVLFRALQPVSKVHISSCAVDVNGNRERFLAVISINPQDASLPPSRNIDVRRNRIYDSGRPGQTSREQRQYILLTNCRDCRVQQNHLSEGGRIKVGRPGRALTIEDNVVEHANDNAITVADLDSGHSEDIVIARNRVLAPLGIGIFFGADGDHEGSPALTLKKVRILSNVVEGNWDYCIFGRPPAQASDIQIRLNTCRKTGVSKRPDPSGIVLKRTCGADQAATDILIEENKVLAAATPPTGALLDQGGINVSGIYRNFRVLRNEIRKVGPRGIYFRYVKMTQTAVKGNDLIEGGFIILGNVAGELQPHTQTGTAAGIPEACPAGPPVRPGDGTGPGSGNPPGTGTR